jgi:hypothetical protein
MFNLFHPHDFFLVEYLDGVEPTVVARSDEVDTAERSCTEAVFFSDDQIV